MHKSGMTLIEILVVVALMSIVLGGGIAIYNRAGKVNETTATVYDIKSVLTRARNTSLSQGQRVEVAFDLLHNQVLSYLRRPIAYLHFEDRDNQNSGRDAYNVREFLIAGPGSVVKAQAVDNVKIKAFEGKDGNCIEMNLDTLQNSKPGYIRIPYQQTYDCQKGITIACDFKIYSYPTEKNPMVLFAKGDSLYLAISEGGSFVARGSFQGQLIHKDKFVLGFPDNSLSDIDVVTQNRISLNKWHHVELSLSNIGLRIALDGVLLESFLGEELAGKDNQLPQTPDSQAEIALNLASFYLPIYQNEITIGAFSGGNDAFEGLIDNVQISEIESGDTIQLLPDIQMFGEFGELNTEEDLFNPGGSSETYSFGKIWVYFGPDGFLDPAYHRNSVLIYLRNIKNQQTKRIKVSTSGIVN